MATFCFSTMCRAASQPFGLAASCFESMYFEDDVREFMTEKQLVSLTVSAGFRNIQIKKVIVLPWDKVDSFNRVLERTLFRHFGLFILLSADK